MFLTHYYHKVAWEEDINIQTSFFLSRYKPLYGVATKTLIFFFKSRKVFRVKEKHLKWKHIICCVPGKTFCIGNEEHWCCIVTPTIPPFGHIWCIYQEWYQEGLVFFKRKNNNSNNDTLYVWIHLHIFQALYIQAQFSAA